jgi:hypothetical protein
MTGTVHGEDAKEVVVVIGDTVVGGEAAASTCPVDVEVIDRNVSVGPCVVVGGISVVSGSAAVVESRVGFVVVATVVEVETGAVDVDVVTVSGAVWICGGRKTMGTAAAGQY